MEGRGGNNVVPAAEDWCFVCKDGGDLILCDTLNCRKVYHHECLGYDGESTSEIEEETWRCDWHFCSTCKAASEVYCFCCPSSFCRNCVNLVKFAQLRGNKGLCRDCWTLVRLAEKISFSKKFIDFEDRETEECLFKEYWEIVKVKEGLTKAVVMRVEAAFSSSSEGKRRMARPRGIGKTLQLFPHKDRRLGWGSQPLVHFLTSIGVDTTKQLSRCDATSIIFNYIQERDLIHPVNKKKVICDRNLHLIFKKNTVPMKHIDRILGSHFADTCLESEHNGAAAANKHMKSLSLENKLPEEEDKGYFASLVANNIKLVYLRRSLVEDLLKHPESFEAKVVGSFVNVMIKIDSRERCKGKIPQQLLQVTGVMQSSSTDGRSVVLHVCSLPDMIHISMLSDSDLTEEDCEDLRKKMAKDLFQRPTVEEIEKKARILYQDIKKDWMETELVNLQNRIDHANEKGRRNELYRLIEQRERLKKEAEQEGPLIQLPTIIADREEPMPAADGGDDSLSHSSPSSST